MLYLDHALACILAPVNVLHPLQVGHDFEPPACYLCCWGSLGCRDLQGSNRRHALRSPRFEEIILNLERSRFVVWLPKIVMVVLRCEITLGLRW